MRPVAVSLTIVLAGLFAIYVMDLGASPFVVTLVPAAGFVAVGAGVIWKRMTVSVLGLGVLLAAYLVMLISAQDSIVRVAVLSAVFIGLCEFVFLALEPEVPELPAEILASLLGTTLLVMVGAGVLSLLFVIAAYYIDAPSPWTALLGALSFVALAVLGRTALNKVR